MKCIGVSGALLVAAVLSVSSAAPLAADDGLIDRTPDDCSADKESFSCFKYKVFSRLDDFLNKRDSFSLGPDVSIVKSETIDEDKPSGRSLNGQTTDFETLVVNRFERFLRSHTINFSVKASDVLDGFANVAESVGLIPESSTGMEEGRGKKKKAAKILLPLMLALKLKLASMLPFLMAAIALMAKKALIVGKLALLISSLIGLKKLFGNQQKSVTYEIVSHPHHSGHDVWSGGDYGNSGSGGGGGHGGGWGRSNDASQKLAYNSYVPRH